MDTKKIPYMIVKGPLDGTYSNNIGIGSIKWPYYDHIRYFYSDHSLKAFAEDLR